MIEQPEKRITNNRNISCRKSLQSTQTFIIFFRKPQITITCDVPRPPNRYRQYYKKIPHYRTENKPNINQRLQSLAVADEYRVIKISGFC